MKDIFVLSVLIENYKCFERQAFEFSIPDGHTPGSGLNLVIGENGTGKTALLEAINYSSQSSYAAENRLQIQDFRDHAKPLRIQLGTSDFTCKMAAPYKDATFDCDGVEFKARSRDKKAPGKLLSSKFTVSSMCRTKTDNYRNAKGEPSGNPIPSLYKQFGNANIQDADLNIFYFDKNRTRQLTTGNYRTTFERICDDLNWKFLKNLTPEKHEKILANVTGEYFTEVMSTAQKGTGARLASEMADFFQDERYKDLRIDLLDLLHPFTESFFAVRDVDALKQIRPKDLGSGVEMVLTLLLLRSIAAESKGGVVYLFDEPELHLHPKAQRKLVELLVKEAMHRQIFISTHSPYVIKDCMAPAARKIVLVRNGATVGVEDTQDPKWGLFPWSPSWGEINFAAYGLPTVEYHNELYGFLQEKHSLSTIDQVEQFLETKGVTSTKTWSRLRAGKQEPASPVSLCTYVRNSIHHPENAGNTVFSSVELAESIAVLRKVI